MSSSSCTKVEGQPHHRYQCNASMLSRHDQPTKNNRMEKPGLGGLGKLQRQSRSVTGILPSVPFSNTLKSIGKVLKKRILFRQPDQLGVEALQYKICHTCVHHCPSLKQSPVSHSKNSLFQVWTCVWLHMSGGNEPWTLHAITIPRIDAKRIPFQLWQVLTTARLYFPGYRPVRRLGRTLGGFGAKQRH